ncbi:DUF2345 domain-containing protein [Variovorax rhizosphaerae]|uniref:DUF2345 domain-containing protein n=1 Tax=Variovorax rhizosphaerae TaxID=1836200 RepID=UPI003BF4B150
MSAKEAVRMFAYKSGMKLVAASSDIDITALKDSINVLAKLNITHTANKITITAKDEVVINGGSSYSKWNASGIEHGTNGVWREHASVHSLVGPMNIEKRSRMEEASQNDKYSVRFAALGSDDLFNHVGMAGLPYKILGENKMVIAEGSIPKDGRLPRVTFDMPDEAILILGEDGWELKPLPGMTPSLSNDTLMTQDDIPPETGDADAEQLRYLETSKYVRETQSSSKGLFLSEAAILSFLEDHWSGE